jgi:hypothetical protein
MSTSCSSCSSSAAAGNAVQFQVSIAVEKKRLDAAKAAGAAAVQLLDAAAQLSRSTETGQLFDALS